MNDADLDKAVEAVIGSKFRNAGQTCICTNRVFVQEEVYEAFVEVRKGSGTVESRRRFR